MKKEYCGLFGVYGHKEAARMTYFGLYALQHRGQESAGIVTWDGETIREQKGMGLVADVFNERHLSKELKGDIAMGHIRYSTTGASLIRNAQPFLVRHGDLRLAVAHNGNLVNTYELRTELEQNGSIFQTTMDTEVFAHLIIKYLHETDTIEAAIAKACSRVRGAYSMLIMANDKLIALKDPNGVRPLGLGRVGDRYVFATETCAFDLIEAEYLRPLEPGEIVTIHKNKLTSLRFNDTEPKRQCIFELIYFARPDSNIFGDVVYERRKAMGVMLAKEAPVDADFVMPFPDSGNYAAVGYSQESGLPLELAMIRNHYVGRTFIQPSQDMRDFSVRVKLNPVKSMVKGKRIIIIEDSIVRGTTIRARVRKLRELGARELHLRVSCPAIKFPCFYGIDFSSKGELIAANHSVEDIARFMGLDSLHYLTIPGLLDSVTDDDAWCLACFDGNYPIPLSDKMGKDCLEANPGIIKEFC
ncbi:MAG: amidophosphoribosyltransferase [Pseudodesulfovibrio sp.]|uniref:amidophosphoribosyltransferase n=1 Tax=Pseudodesulfovibrio TaxID=2035811 RepID=UPI001E0D928D|nr:MULTISPECIES: amidophosphoribosyltransferase [Pseudodesulfovibrio]MBU4192351.1 amidophosphoribosyltransferase [Pseudomonadota bacterium]MBU4378321.1 amidophosphoribosyltransferase [Pseudomonadota bacterium]MBU4476091.1 amidophosphoribosyltransferase [Pseudomonadota bacterium]MBU4515313.1 amidophosphoribosyltransferase [Pseudomonadota bacterium]MBU4521218.1 amidophosphoribosyltransferase [Pseudomonadota bacterium]